MANLFLRSPRTFSAIGTSGWNSAKLIITIDSVVIYTLIKNRITNSAVDFEISELVKDYLNLSYNGSIDTLLQSIKFSIQVSVFNGLNGTGSLNQTPTGFTFFGIDAYGYFEEGANPTTTKGYMQTNTVIYNLSGQNIRIPIDVNNVTRWDALKNGAIIQGAIVPNNSNKVFEYIEVDSNADRLGLGITGPFVTFIDIINIEECRYQPHKISFVNRWGAIQDLYFFKKSIDKISTTKESFKSSNVTSGGVYSVTSHSNKDFNVKSNKSITLNSGYVSEDYNAPMQELLQSELVWMEVGGVVTPLNVTDSSLVFKTSANDKLVDYKLELKFAYDAINNMR
tara:strand:+ start:23 stop:1039 length:1017 start_codon:yes stop_codon:yes gene_type:complete